MASRRKVIQEIIHNFQVIKHKIYTHLVGESTNGITRSQGLVLDIIHRYPEISIKDIAKILGISSSAATQLVHGLVRHKYVVRIVNKKDRRGLNIILSKKGKQEIVSMKRERLVMAETFFEGLSKKELEQYLKFQAKILSRM